MALQTESVTPHVTADKLHRQRLEGAYFPYIETVQLITSELADCHPLHHPSFVTMDDERIVIGSAMPYSGQDIFVALLHQNDPTLLDRHLAALLATDWNPESEEPHRFDRLVAVSYEDYALIVQPPSGDTVAVLEEEELMLLDNVEMHHLLDLLETLEGHGYGISPNPDCIVYDLEDGFGVTNVSHRAQPFPETIECAAACLGAGSVDTLGVLYAMGEHEEPAFRELYTPLFAERSALYGEDFLDRLLLRTAVLQQFQVACQQRYEGVEEFGAIAGRIHHVVLGVESLHSLLRTLVVR